MNAALPHGPRNEFSVDVLKESSRRDGRVLRITTPHGEVTTPSFMPVGTYASVAALTPQALRTAGAQMILGGNTYHMLCAPGLDVIQNLGGMHRFMAWDGPMLTDSGGFQAFSLSRRSDHARIEEEGPTLRNPNSGETLRLTPETVIEAQRVIGADVIMALDQCTPDSADRELVVAAMRRTHRWLEQCCTRYRQNPYSVYGAYQALFGIVQGGPFQDLRLESAEYVVSKGLEGVAIGGESVGYNMKATVEIMHWLHGHLPRNKPRYMMGVGLVPQDLFDVVGAGADIFDCVAPTRLARHGHVYVGRSVRRDGWVEWESEEPRARLNLQNKRFERDDRPIQEGCTCTTCGSHSRGYLRYLLKSRAIVYYSLASVHNIHVMMDACKAMRECILEE